MTKNQTTIRKIIAAITIVSLAIFVIYSFTSSEKNEDANQNDPKVTQNEVAKDEKTTTEETGTGSENILMTGLNTASQYINRYTVLGGYLGLGLSLYMYSDKLMGWTFNKKAIGITLFIIAGGAGLGYLFHTKLLKGSSAETNPYIMGIINTSVAVLPSLILGGIGYLVYKKKAPLNPSNNTNEIAALNKILMLMGVGVLVGVAIGALTFTVVSYLKYYEEVDTADSMGQFLPKLNPALHGQEMRCLGVLSLITALVSSKAWEHDVWSWETAAILGAIIVGALLTIQIVHTLGSKLPGKCTLLGALAWLFIYALSVLLNKAPDTWWDWKNIGSSLAMLFMGYVFDACGKPWVDWLEGRKVFLTNININIFIVNLGLVVLATPLILFTNGGYTWGIMPTVILITVIAAVVYIGYYSYDAYAMAESVSSFRKDHGGKRLAQLAVSIVVSSMVVAYLTWHGSKWRKWNDNQSYKTNQDLADVPNMALMCNYEHSLALACSVVTYGAIGMFTGYYDPISPKSSLLFLPGFMLSEFFIWHSYYRRKSHRKQLDMIPVKISQLWTEIKKNFKRYSQTEQNKYIIGLVNSLIRLSKLDGAKIMLSQKDSVIRDNRNIWAETLVDLLDHQKITAAIKGNKSMQNKVRNTQVYLAELVFLDMVNQFNNPEMYNDNSIQLTRIVAKLQDWFPKQQAPNSLKNSSPKMDHWKEAVLRKADTTNQRYVDTLVAKLKMLKNQSNTDLTNVINRLTAIQKGSDSVDTEE